MLHIILFEPEIPQNTGNIMRMATNTSATLHLIEPLGFECTDTQLKRCRLDYLPNYIIHHNFDALKNWLYSRSVPLYASTTHSKTLYSSIQYPSECAVIFGPESRGLPQEIYTAYPNIRIPMHPDSRSINLSNAVAIVSYEILRQHTYPGLI